jgi:hypothetical protein
MTTTSRRGPTVVTPAAGSAVRGSAAVMTPATGSGPSAGARAMIAACPGQETRMKYQCWLVTPFSWELGLQV